MLWNRKRASDKPVWRDKNGKVFCPGDECPEKCGSACPVWLNTCALEELMRSQPGTAISYLRQAIVLAPDFADAHNNLGTAYGMSNRHKDAYDSFSKALELKKDYPQALKGLIVSEKNLGMLTEALHHCDILEKLTKTSTQTLREQIKRLKDQSAPTSSKVDWVSLLLFLMKDGREHGHVQSEGIPNIPEILVQADQTCDKLYQGMQKACENHPEYDCVRFTFAWAALAGIGAVYHWDKDWPALSATGIFETLTAERGVFAMDEYVLNCIGLPHEGDEAKALSGYLYQLAAKCILKIATDSTVLGQEAVMQGAKAMYAFGMVIEMNRLGMK